MKKNHAYRIVFLFFIVTNIPEIFFGLPKGQFVQFLATINIQRKCRFPTAIFKQC